MFSCDIDSNDFKSSGHHQVIQNVMTKLDKQGKGVILMHDLQKHTAIALPALLRRLKAGGYKVVQMRAKEQLETLPEYDAMLVKEQKVPAVASRPISSVVQTVSQSVLGPPPRPPPPPPVMAGLPPPIHDFLRSGILE